MSGRIKDKIDEIEKYLEELAETRPQDLDKYIADFKAKAACERYAERITEAAVDLAFLFIRERKLPLPESDLQSFNILSQNNIITQKLAEKLQDAKRMRNIIAHEYGNVDDEVVFHSISEELGKDVNEFIHAIRNNAKI